MKALVLASAVFTGLVLAGSTDAATITYVADLTGAAEVPSNDSPGTGSSTLTVDTVAQTFAIEVTFEDLLGTTTAAHIHGPTPEPGMGTASPMTAVPTFPEFPLGSTSGSYAQVFDLTDAATYNPAFVTTAGSLEAAAAAFLEALASGSAYLNVHSTAFTSGEIRGFYELAPIPLPASLPLLGSVLALGLVLRRRR